MSVSKSVHVFHLLDSNSGKTDQGSNHLENLPRLLFFLVTQCVRVKPNEAVVELLKLCQVV